MRACSDPTHDETRQVADRYRRRGGARCGGRHRGRPAVNESGKRSRCAFEPVTRRDLVASVTASGQVEPHTKVHISADITRPDRAPGGEGGSDGQKGAIPAADRPSTYQAAVDRAQAALAGARAQAVQAEPASSRPERSTTGRPRSRRQCPA